MRKVNVGIVGCGAISEVYLKNCATAFESLNVVACADLVESKARERAEAYKIRAMRVDDILADRSIEVILNLTVPRAHAEISLKALENGKHVYSEKPLAVAREDGRAIIESAKAKGLLVGCAPDTFMGAGLQTCRKLLDDGWIGKPFGAIAFMIGCGPERFHPNPEFFYQKGGGPMLDMGPYYVTALVALLGSVKRVTGMATTPYREKTILTEARYGQRIKVETPTYINGTMEFANGVCASLLTSFDLHYPPYDSKLPCIQLFGSEGTLNVSDPNTFRGPVSVRRFGGEFVEVPLTHNFAENSRGIGLADMAVAIAKGETKFRANGAMAYHVLDIMTGIFESSEKGIHISPTSACERPEPMPRVTLKNSTIGIER